MNSNNFLNLNCNLVSTETANIPKTAPDAPKLIMLLGWNRTDAMLEPADQVTIVSNGISMTLLAVTHTSSSKHAQSRSMSGCCLHGTSSAVQMSQIVKIHYLHYMSCKYQSGSVALTHSTQYVCCPHTKRSLLHRINVVIHSDDYRASRKHVVLNRNQLRWFIGNMWPTPDSCGEIAVLTQIAWKDSLLLLSDLSREYDHYKLRRSLFLTQR